MRSIALISALAIGAIAAPAVAQDFSMMSDWAQGQMLNDNLQRNLGVNGRSSGPPVYAVGRGIRTPRNPAPGSVAIPVGPHGAGAPIPGPVVAATGQPVYAAEAPMQVATTYRASPEVRLRVRNQFVDFIRKSSGPQAAAAIGAEMARHDQLALWAQHAAQDGLRPGDVADAIAAYWVENWQMANGVDFARPEHVRAVRDQVRFTLAANPGFARLTDAQKQEMAEIFIYNQILQDSNYVTAMKAGDRATVQKLADASVARFRNEMHLDLRQLALTDRGFIRKA